MTWKPVTQWGGNGLLSPYSTLSHLVSLALMQFIIDTEILVLRKIRELIMPATNSQVNYCASRKNSLLSFEWHHHKPHRAGRFHFRTSHTPGFEPIFFKGKLENRAHSLWQYYSHHITQYPNNYDAHKENKRIRRTLIIDHPFKTFFSAAQTLWARCRIIISSKRVKSIAKTHLTI